VRVLRTPPDPAVHERVLRTSPEHAVHVRVLNPPQIPGIWGGLDFPRNNGHKKCPDGVDFRHQEKRYGRQAIS
jgi:hypothetical protein